MEQNFPETLAAPTAEKLHPAATQRASEVIFEQIQSLILSGELKPGDRLPSERSLMERLQRSRPTIREALRMLEHAGLIRTIPGANGAIVCEPGTDGVEKSLMVMLQTSRVTVAELTEYRMANETAIARWAAARRTEADLERLEALLDVSEKLLRSGNFGAFIEQDAAFHRELARTGQNTVAAIMAELMSRLADPKMRAAIERQSSAENRKMCARILKMHRNILRAVCAGDALAAEEAMASHITAFGCDLED